MTRWRSWWLITAPAAVAMATAVHVLAWSVDPGCGWAQWAIIVAAQLVVAAVFHPILYPLWRRP